MAVKNIFALTIFLFIKLSSPGSHANTRLLQIKTHKSLPEAVNKFPFTRIVSSNCSGAS